ncbi:MAG: BACON domain-containing protein [Bacteroidaceae bacterium]|nr:BACON domain-containing protein [Bacteroidaceae bacterium]
MKQRLRILALLLIFNFQFSMFNCALAQDENAAFYIYRNDGDFDGFFYDEIVRMGYSKFDLDSVEYDVYVVQEIETKDSLYRIPLAAIDSIGFQQPEIKLNPRLKVMDDVGLSPYVNHVLRDDNYIVLNTSTPADLLPKEGDVLVGLNDYKYGPGGYSGKVTSVVKKNQGYTVQCVPLQDLSDVFVQFITTERIGKDKQGNVRRRIAGFDNNGCLKVNRSEGNSDITLLNLSGTLQKEWKPNDKTSITLGLNLGGELKLSMVYNITWTRLFVKLMFSESFEVGASVKAAVETGGEETFPYATGTDVEIKFPAALPMFGVKPVPKAFVRAKGELNATVNFPKFKWGSTQTIIFDSKAEKFMTGYLTDKDHPGEDEDLLSGMSGGFAWNGFFQTGIKEDATVNTNSWFRGIFYASYGMEIYAGPKLEGEVNLSVDGLMDNGAYGMLKDSKIEYSVFSVDLENKARMKYLWHDPEERTFWSSTKKFGTSTWYLFPDFKKTDVDYNEATNTLTAAVHPRRQVFWKSWVGARLFDISNRNDIRQVADNFNESESYNFFNTFNEYKATFQVLRAGHYRVMPALRTLGCVVLDYGNAEDVDILPTLNVQGKKEFVFDAGSHNQSITFTTNAPRVEVRTWYAEYDDDDNLRYYGMSESDGWISAIESSDETTQGSHNITLLVDKNSGFVGREGIVVIGVHDGTDLWKRDTIYVRQYGGGTFAKANITIGSNVKYSGDKDYTGWSTNTEFENGIEFIPVHAMRDGDMITIVGDTTVTTKSSSDKSNSIMISKLSLNLTIDSSHGKMRIISGTCSGETTSNDNSQYPYGSHEWIYIYERRTHFESAFRGYATTSSGRQHVSYLTKYDGSYSQYSKEQTSYTDWELRETRRNYTCRMIPKEEGQHPDWNNTFNVTFYSK